jgi:hypothetical protein
MVATEFTGGKSVYVKQIFCEPLDITKEEGDTEPVEELIVNDDPLFPPHITLVQTKYCELPLASVPAHSNCSTSNSLVHLCSHGGNFMQIVVSHFFSLLNITIVKQTEDWELFVWV